MSLDVWLEMPGAQVQPDAERIFVRRNGATVEVTREEWEAEHPGREPVVLLNPEPTDEVYSANITHNLGRMADACGLYEPLWRPEATHAAQLIEPLRAGLERLRSDRERLLEFNPKNGWGNYELLVSFTENYLAACEEFPDAEVRVSA